MFSEKIKKQMLSELNKMRDAIETRKKAINEINMSSDIEFFNNELRRINRCFDELYTAIDLNNTVSIAQMSNEMQGGMLIELEKINILTNSKETNSNSINDLRNYFNTIRLYLNEVLLTVNPDKVFELEQIFAKEKLAENFN